MFSESICHAPVEIETPFKTEFTYFFVQSINRIFKTLYDNRKSDNKAQTRQNEGKNKKTVMMKHNYGKR